MWTRKLQAMSLDQMLPEPSISFFGQQGSFTQSRNFSNCSSKFQSGYCTMLRAYIIVRMSCVLPQPELKFSAE